MCGGCSGSGVKRIFKPLGDVARDNATYSCPWLKTGCGR